MLDAYTIAIDLLQWLRWLIFRGILFFGGRFFQD
jgi:hypothetical protein